MIIDHSPYFNEKTIAKIKVAENKRWMDRLRVVESDRSFSYDKKEYSFDMCQDPFVDIIRLDGTQFFTPKRIRLTRSYPFLKYSADKWKNESIQRNSLVVDIKPSQDDVIILSDIDEIIDHRMSNLILEQVHRHGIITVKLHFTMFYFNLKVLNWGGPPDYSYRVFLMTGDFFNKHLKYSSDQLRKLGESGELMAKVKCLDEICGFHHSWVGDQNFIVNKINAYAHSRCDHDPGLYNRDGSISMEFVNDCLLNNKSIFGDKYKLQVDDDLNFLESVCDSRCEHVKYFVSK